MPRNLRVSDLALYKAGERERNASYPRSGETFLSGGTHWRPAEIDEDHSAIQTPAKIAQGQGAQRGHHGHQPSQDRWNMVSGDAVTLVSDALRLATAKNRKIRRVLQSQPVHAALFD